MKRKSTRYYSDKQETTVAKIMSGSKIPNSGATPFVKGDVMTSDWLIECKTCMTPKQSFSIKKNWLLKNKEEAFAMGKHFNCLCFDFGNEDRYYVLDEKIFKQLI